MARPATSIKVTGAGHRSKAEVIARTEAEDRLRGSSSLSAEPPERLSASQGKIYQFLHQSLTEAGVLSVLDRECLTNAAITFDRLAQVDMRIEDGGTEALFNRTLCSIRDTYLKQATRIMTDLCLTPSARGKLGAAIANAKKDSKDPLLEALE